MWAHCLHMLVKLGPPTADRPKLIQEARERFDAAAHCDATDWKLHNEWGTLLIAQVDTWARTEEQRQAVFMEAKQHFEKGLELALARSDKALLEQQVGLSLIRLGSNCTVPEQKRNFYDEAIA